MRRIIEILILLALSCFVAAGAQADAPAYRMIREKSFIKFFAIQNDAPVEGRFNDFTTDIRFDPEHLDQSSVKVEVSIGSLEVANEDVQKTLKLPEWLSADAFPKAVFTCKKFTRMPSSNNYYVDGQLTLRGKTVPVSLNFQMEHFDGTNAVATGYVSIHRKDFDIGQGEWSRDDVVKNEVRVEFRVAAEK